MLIGRYTEYRTGVDVRRTFSFKVHGDTHTLLQHVRRRAARQGVKLVGDENRGTFTGMMTGHYEVSEERARVTVVNKPIFYPWDAVEKWLHRALMIPGRGPVRSLGGDVSSMDGVSSAPSSDVATRG